MRRLALALLLGCGSPQTEPATPIALASATKPEPPPEKKGPSLAKSTSTHPASTSGLDVVVTATEIRVRGERVAPDKKNGPNDLLIVALADVAAKSNEHEATLAIAPDVTYRTLFEVLFTLGQSDVDTFHLLVAGPNGTASIDPVVPHLAGPSADAVSGSSRRPRATLNLTVLVVAEGFSVKASGGNLTTSCNSIGKGLAIPTRDFEALAACVAKAKSTSPEFTEEDTATMSAQPDMDFQTLVRAIDAIRASFPKVQLAIAH